MEKGRFFHIQMTPRYLLLQIEAHDDAFAGEVVKFRDGTPATRAQAIAFLEKMERDGLEVIPCCANCDEKGRCQGEPQS